MSRLLRVENGSFRMLELARMREKRLSETRDLERWIVEHPALIDPTLMVVTTQFDKWLSGSGTAAERLDILALASSGELVVIELKLGSDRNVHLQAITYAALASGFTEESLARAHAEWLSNATGQVVSEDTALGVLQAHVDEWSEELLRLPRIVLVAERFTAQVLTTVEWLRGIADGLQIECHEYSVFDEGGAVTVAFDRIYPVVGIDDQILKPGRRAASQQVAIRASNQRRARSVAIIHEHKAIHGGARIDLKLQGQARGGVVQRIEAWLDADAARRDVTWVDDPVNPLRWGAALESDKRWTPSSLRNEIFRLAGAEQHAFSAADAWSCSGRTLAEIALACLSEPPVEQDE
ncbi:hypothetical protein ABIB37_000797 [Agrococcus sp. UYP10]|uniref:hypothetical protein n=1 Tax=Agrococcus sp. UYP10 TaxID=1756355 RepID=UPI0033995C3E